MTYNLKHNDNESFIFIMRNLNYVRRTSIVLSNEDYTNAGLKQEDMMEAIKKIDGVWMVEKCRINSNIEVHLKSNNAKYAEDVVFDIKMVLECMLSGI